MSVNSNSICTFDVKVYSLITTWFKDCFRFPIFPFDRRAYHHLCLQVKHQVREQQIKKEVAGGDKRTEERGEEKKKAPTHPYKTSNSLTPYSPVLD